VFPVQSRTVAEEEGILTEVDLTNRIEISPERRAQGMAKSLEDLKALGYAEGRASHILEARKEKERMRNLVMELSYDIYYETGDEAYRVTRGYVWKMKPKILKMNIEELTEVLNGIREAKEPALIP